MVASPHPTDNETPRETLERMGEHKVRALLPMGAVPQYLEPAALDWIAELDASRASRPKAASSGKN